MRHADSHRMLRRGNLYARLPDFELHLVPKEHSVEVIGLLCDHAQVSGGKLFVSGAAISRITSAPVDPPFRVNVALAVVVTIPWTATNQAHELTIELVSETSEGNDRIPLAQGLPPGANPSNEGKIIAQFNAGRAPEMHPGEDSLMPIALPLPGFPLPRPGDYFFEIEVDGSKAARVSFALRVLNPAFGPFGT